MTLGVLFAFIIVVSKTAESEHHSKEATVPIQDRIKLLKYNFNREVKHIANEEVTTLLNENIDYVDFGNAPLKPIEESDEQKKDGKYKLRKLKTTTTTIQAWETTNKYNGRDNDMKEFKKKIRVNKPVDTFYRRLLSENLMATPVRWVHCQAVITPYFSGMKKELGLPEILYPTDRIVVRLIELIGQNTTGFSYEDIRALMYHINDVKIRLFQWDTSAIRLLFNTIGPKQRHTFKTLKHSIKSLFKRWHLDYHDTKKLLQQTRLFRPPCINYNYGGSTKSSKVSRYIKSTTPTTNDDCDDE